MRHKGLRRFGRLLHIGPTPLLEVLSNDGHPLAIYPLDCALRAPSLPDTRTRFWAARGGFCPAGKSAMTGCAATNSRVPRALPVSVRAVRTSVVISFHDRTLRPAPRIRHNARATIVLRRSGIPRRA